MEAISFKSGGHGLSDPRTLTRAARDYVECANSAGPLQTRRESRVGLLALREGRLPTPVANAAIQPLDSSARNLLTCNRVCHGLCGLRANSGERVRSEEWPGESGMWPGTANSGGWRSPQASAEILNNTRELARSGKKKPQPRTVGVCLFGGAGGI